MMKVLVGVTFGLLGAAITSGCVVRSEPVVVRPASTVVVRPAPVVVYQPAVVVPAYKYKYKHKHKHKGWGDDQGENEQ
jgi:hypothetical protein